MEEIIEKLKDILSSEGLTNIKAKDIANALKIHPDTFNSMKFRNAIPYKQILNFLHERNININYFFYGTSPKNTLECESTYRILKLYKTNASLGGGGYNEYLESEDIIIDDKLLSRFKAKKCDLITCYGDSMEPLIKGNSILLCDKQKAYKNSNIYAVNTIDGLFVKQVFMKDNGCILRSINTAYNDMFYHHGEYIIVGEIIAEIRSLKWAYE